MLVRRKFAPRILEISTGADLNQIQYITLSVKICSGLAQLALSDAKKSQADLATSENPVPTLDDYHENLALIGSLIPQLARHLSIFGTVAKILDGEAPVEKFADPLIEAAHSSRNLYDAILAEDPAAETDLEITAALYHEVTKALQSELDTLRSRHDLLAEECRRAATRTLANKRVDASKVAALYDSTLDIAQDATSDEIRKAALVQLQAERDQVNAKAAARKKQARYEITTALADLWAGR